VSRVCRLGCLHSCGVSRCRRARALRRRARGRMRAPDITACAQSSRAPTAGKGQDGERTPAPRRQGPHQAHGRAVAGAPTKMRCGGMVVMCAPALPSQPIRRSRRICPRQAPGGARPNTECDAARAHACAQHLRQQMYLSGLATGRVRAHS